MRADALPVGAASATSMAPPGRVRDVVRGREQPGDGAGLAGTGTARDHREVLGQGEGGGPALEIRAGSLAGLSNSWSRMAVSPG